MPFWIQGKKITENLVAGHSAQVLTKRFLSTAMFTAALDWSRIPMASKKAKGHLQNLKDLGE
jgi:hypothetical protein